MTVEEKTTQDSALRTGMRTRWESHKLLDHVGAVCMRFGSLYAAVYTCDKICWEYLFCAKQSQTACGCDCLSAHTGYGAMSKSS